MAESKQKEVAPVGARKIRKITIENFMSHERTELEFADGITLLSGANNCGKSAVVVALRAICGMTRGNWMVRHDEKQANVLNLVDQTCKPFLVKLYKWVVCFLAYVLLVQLKFVFLRDYLTFYLDTAYLIHTLQDAK